ncbi:calcium uptake protein 3, mitochondrial-like [Rhopilema esculentum]|uniref:calcium uptake protein 3, mitochondrial-like n=1 Tax=Rhopilema esculentum TaxID=499914 RepID=UPI0031D4F651
MAARRLCIFFGSSRYLKSSRPQKFCQFHTKSTVNGSLSRNVIAFTSGCFGSLALFELYNYKQVPGPGRTLICIAASEEGKAEEAAPKVMSRRERRFNQFASCDYNGEVLMTAQDFLESLTENEPKFSRTSKVNLKDEDLEKIKQKTPGINSGSHTFFRDLHQNGVITYSEYLFLVTILTKSRTGLKIAFKMIDVDGNHHINKEEFQGIQQMINKSSTRETRNGQNSLDYTTLLTHLFGHDGKRELTFEQFFKFMDDLQSEVLELEFHEFSKSMKTISELDFARILLRNTVLSADEHEDYLNRLHKRIPEPKGVTLGEFKAFNRFLNNVDDFVVAMRMFNMMHEPIGQDVFIRAIKVSTGEDINPYVINVVFQLFDIDGDGKLSDVEFVGIMKDRLKRGFGKFPSPVKWAGFKHCLRKEVKQG